MKSAYIKQKIYTLIYRCLPYGTQRRKIASILLDVVKNPKMIIRKLSFRKLLKSFYILLTNRQEFKKKTKVFLMVCGLSKPETIVEYKMYTPKKNILIFPKEEQPLVSIVIPVHNKWINTLSCLGSILDHTAGVQYEVLVADDNSDDDTVRILDYVKNIHVIRNSGNKESLLNCNHAAGHAKGKYILFLNNDANVLPNWLKPLVELIQSSEKIGMVGSKLVSADGRLREAGGIIWRDGSFWNYGENEDPSRSEFNYVKEVDYISGTCFIIKKGLWQKIGGFDEQYSPAYYEDKDLAFEVRKNGYKVMLQPKSVVIDFGETSDEDIVNSHQVQNLNKFMDKWRDVLDTEHDMPGQNLFLNRDRSKQKKNILVFDYGVPQYDKDAGSRTTFNYLKLFVKMGFNVKFLDDKYSRCEPYTSVLENMGIEVFYGSWYYENLENWLEDNGRYLDYVYINRPHIAEKYIDMVKKHTRSKIFYYGHDLHYLREYRQYQLTKKHQFLVSSEKQKEIEFEIIRKADVIYYPSCTEIEELKPHFSNKTLRAIPAYIFDEPQTEMNFNWAERKDLIFVGGFLHQPNVDGAVWFVKSVLPSILKAYPELKVYLVGSNPPPEIKALNSKNVVATGYVTDEELEKMYQKGRVVIVPLRFGAGVKGKVVEALYHRMPVVTTSIGAEGLPDIEGKMFLSDDAKDFAETIIRVYDNVSLLDETSQKLKNYIRNYFSEDSVLKILHRDFGYDGINQEEVDV